MGRAPPSSTRRSRGSSFPAQVPSVNTFAETYPGNPAEMVIVGVVSDAKYNSLREKMRPRIYAPLFNPMWKMTAAVYEVRTFANPTSVSASLRQAVQATGLPCLASKFAPCPDC